MKRASVWRLLVLALAAMIVLSMNVSSAQAAEVEEPQTFSTSVTRTNPLYASGDAPAAPAAETAPPTYVAMDFWGAVEELREIMEYRNTAAILAFPVLLESDMDDEAALEQELLAYEEALFWEAMAHTGYGLHGDYLLYSVYQYGAEIFVTEEDGITVLAIIYNFVYHTTREQEQELSTVTEKLRKSWRLGDDATDYEKVCAVYDWLCENVTYAEAIPEGPSEIYSAYGAIVNGESACQGYAAAVYRLLWELNVDCRIITGIGNSEPHAWNIAKVGDYYYNLDATWDATRYQEGLDYAWFLTSDANFPYHYRLPEFSTEEFYIAYPMGHEDYYPSVIGSGICGDDLNWFLTDDRTFIIVGTGPMYDYTEETQPWKDYQDQIARVYIDSGATSIGNFAFSSCTRLHHVFIPEGVTTIGDHAFNWCRELNDITLPDSLVSIGASAFHLCDLTSITIPDSVTSIGDHAFETCTYLTSITIPSSVKSIGVGVFSGCNRLKSVTIMEGLTEISDSAFKFCAELTDVFIPESVTSIGSEAFAYCNCLTGIVLPESVTSIGSGAFSDCSKFADIKIPDSVTSIGANAFSNCAALCDITLPAGITSIADGVFYGCGITGITIPESVTSIGVRAFAGTPLTDITIPESVTSIGARAFENCSSLTGFTIPKSVTGISEGMFQNSGLRSITIPEHVTSIGESAFSGTKITNITLPESVTSIAAGTFASCSNLTDITIPDSVTSIGTNAFSDCDALTDITIPASVTSIGDGAFAACDSLTGFAIPAGVTSISKSMFAGSGLVSITIPKHVTSIGESAFEQCRSLTSIMIPDSVTSIGNNAFEYCDSLISITLPDSVTSIEMELFRQCYSLTSVVLPKGVTDIGFGAFYLCEKLTNIVILEGVTTISDNAFYGCLSLPRITIPKSVATVSHYAFAGCTNMTETRFLGDAPAIGRDAFYNVPGTAYYPAGAAGWDAAITQQYGGRFAWVAEERYPFEFMGSSVSLGESLDIHFFLSDYEVQSTDYAVITRTYADGREDHVVTVPYGEWDALGDGRLYITYHGVAAKEMNDSISVVIFDQNGNAVSQTYTDSVQDYAMRLLHSISIDGALQILLVDMLNYGTEAQLFFGYDSEHLANAELVSAEQDYASDDYLVENNLKHSEGRAGTALTLKSRISLDMYFANSVIGDDHSQLYAVITYADHYGNPVEMAVPGDAFVKEDESRCYVPVTGLAIADYRQLVTCTVYDSDGNALAWATDSIEGYIARMEDEIPDIVGALAKFGNIAYYYFHTYLEFTGGAVENPGVVR